jgi:hypothetical protein
MRIRLIIYAFIVALTLDVYVYDGHYLGMALRKAQFGGDRISDEVDQRLSKLFRKAVPSLLQPNLRLE